MIISTKKACAVQQRRYDSGKRGVAKAVRRFAKRSGLLPKVGRVSTESVLNIKVRW